MEYMQAYITLVVMVISMVLYITALIPAPAVALLSSASLVVLGVLDVDGFLSGFSNNANILIIFASVIAGAMETTGSVSYFGKLLTTHINFSERTVLLILMAAAGTLSAFLNNMTVVIVFISIVVSLEASSNGKYKRKNMFMGICAASLGGGSLTLVGSTVQIGVNGVLPEYGVRQIQMWDMLVYLPVFLAMLLWYYFYAYEKGLKIYDFEQLNTLDIKEFPEGDPKSIRMWLPVFSMVGVVIAMINGGDFAVVATIAGMLLVSLKCITPAQAWSSIDWNTVFVCAGSIGLASAMRSSGAADLLATLFVGLFGTNVSPYIYLLVFTFLVL